MSVDTSQSHKTRRSPPFAPIILSRFNSRFWRPRRNAVRWRPSFETVVSSRRTSAAIDLHRDIRSSHIVDQDQASCSRVVETCRKSSCPLDCAFRYSSKCQQKVMAFDSQRDLDVTYILDNSLTSAVFATEEKVWSNEEQTTEDSNCVYFVVKNADGDVKNIYEQREVTDAENFSEDCAPHEDSWEASIINSYLALSSPDQADVQSLKPLMNAIDDIPLESFPESATLFGEAEAQEKMQIYEQIHEGESVMRSMIVQAGDTLLKTKDEIFNLEYI